MVISVVYLLVRWLLACLTVLSRGQVSKDAGCWCFAMRTRSFAARPAGFVTSQPTGCGWWRCRGWFPAAGRRGAPGDTGDAAGLAPAAGRPQV